MKAAKLVCNACAICLLRAVNILKFPTACTLAICQNATMLPAAVLGPCRSSRIISRRLSTIAAAVPASVRGGDRASRNCPTPRLAERMALSGKTTAKVVHNAA